MPVSIEHANHVQEESTSLDQSFFQQQAIELAQSLLGKILRHKVNGLWLAARIIETEAYETTEKASHSSLGESPSRRAMFMPAGTIYMYYARGADSLNFSALGAGDAVLIKSAVPVIDRLSPRESLAEMQRLNPLKNQPRAIDRLCSGQTLICKSLDLKVCDWNEQSLDQDRLTLERDRYQVKSVIQCRRLGIPQGRDEHLKYRFVDESHAKSCTSNPLTKRGWRLHEDYKRLTCNPT